MGKETEIQIREAQKPPKKFSPRRYMSRHIVRKMAKSSENERISKTVKKK